MRSKISLKTIPPNMARSNHIQICHMIIRKIQMLQTRSNVANLDFNQMLKIAFLTQIKLNENNKNYENYENF